MNKLKIELYTNKKLIEKKTIIIKSSTIFYAILYYTDKTSIYKKIFKTRLK